jgi:hypothetical protein
MKETKGQVGKPKGVRELKMRAVHKILKLIKADKNTDDWRKFTLNKDE